MTDYSEAFVGLDVAKSHNAVAIADAGRDGEVRYWGEVNSAPQDMERLVRKLSRRYGRLHFCYEAGCTGYGLYRQIKGLGHDCTVAAPSLIPVKAGERRKTNRIDALKLAKLLRAGDISPVWVPDEAHEALRDLVRTRGAALKDLRRKRQHISSFLLRHGRFYERKAWGRMHAKWLAAQSFSQPTQTAAFHDMPSKQARAWCASRASSRSSCRNGRLRPSPKRSRRCAASRSSTPSPSSQKWAISRALSIRVSS